MNNILLGLTTNVLIFDNKLYKYLFYIYKIANKCLLVVNTKYILVKELCGFFLNYVLFILDNWEYFVIAYCTQYIIRMLVVNTKYISVKEFCELFSKWYIMQFRKFRIFCTYIVFVILCTPCSCYLASWVCCLYSLSFNVVSFLIDIVFLALHFINLL